MSGSNSAEMSSESGVVNASSSSSTSNSMSSYTKNPKQNNNKKNFVQEFGDQLVITGSTHVLLLFMIHHIGTMCRVCEKMSDSKELVTWCEKMIEGIKQNRSQFGQLIRLVATEIRDSAAARIMDCYTSNRRSDRSDAMFYTSWWYNSRVPLSMLSKATQEKYPMCLSEASVSQISYEVAYRLGDLACQIQQDTPNTRRDAFVIEELNKSCEFFKALEKSSEEMFMKYEKIRDQMCDKIRDNRNKTFIVKTSTAKTTTGTGTKLPPPKSRSGSNSNSNSNSTEDKPAKGTGPIKIMQPSRTSSNISYKDKINKSAKASA